MKNGFDVNTLVIFHAAENKKVKVYFFSFLRILKTNQFGNDSHTGNVKHKAFPLNEDNNKYQTGHNGQIHCTTSCHMLFG